MLEINKTHNYNCLEGLKLLDDCSIDCCITSPPYWGLRQYLPDMVRLKDDSPEWVLKELDKLNIKPIDH